MTCVAAAADDDLVHRLPINLSHTTDVISWHTMLPGKFSSFCVSPDN